MTDKETLFFVTGYYIPVDCKEAHQRRCFGVYPTLEKAKELIEGRNAHGVYECLYNYAVIEEMPFGYHPMAINEYWYKAICDEGDYSEPNYVLTSKPEILTKPNIVNFAIG